MTAATSSPAPSSASLASTPSASGSASANAAESLNLKGGGKAGRGSGAGSDQLQLVTFGIGDEEFGVDILAVQEINRMMELTRVPQSPPEVEGVINLRGKIIPVLDLRTRFGLPQSERGEQSRIVVVEVHGKILGFIVDRVHEVLRIDSSIVEPAPAMVCSIDSDFIAGVGRLDDRLLILLDLQRLFDGQTLAAAA